MQIEDLDGRLLIICSKRRESYREIQSRRPTQRSSLRIYRCRMAGLPLIYRINNTLKPKYFQEICFSDSFDVSSEI